MSRKALICTVTADVLAAGLPVHGLTTELATQGPLRGWGWPAGVAELAGSRDRVKGHWSTFGHGSLYYAGDAKAFKVFLDRYARVKDFPARLVLHPATGQKGRRYVTQPSTHYDRALIIETGMAIEREKAKGEPAVPRATLHLYLSDSIGVEDLQVPLNVEVHSGGEIGDVRRRTHRQTESHAEGRRGKARQVSHAGSGSVRGSRRKE